MIDSLMHPLILKFYTQINGKLSKKKYVKNMKVQYYNPKMKNNDFYIFQNIFSFELKVE